MSPVVINGFTIDFSKGEIVKGNATSVLEPKLIAVLKSLLAANGELVSHERLLQEVWGEIVVAPNALQRCIAQLRKHLGDNAKLQQVIKTHPKRGYSLVALASPASTQSPEPLLESKALTKWSSGKKWLLLVLISILFAILAVNYLNTVLPLPKLDKVLSLDTSEGVIASPLVFDDNRLFLVKTEQDKSRIVLRDKLNNTEQVIREQVRVYGKLSLTLDNSELVYGEIIHDQGTKCAQIVATTLSDLTTRVLLPCQDDFLHSVIWLSDQNLIYLTTTKQRQTQAYWFDTETGSRQLLELGEVLAIARAPITKESTANDKYRLAVQYPSALSIVDLHTDFTLDELERFPFVEEYQQAMTMLWHDQDNVLLAKQQSLFWYGLDRDVVEHTLFTSLEISDLAIFEQTIYAILIRDNQQIKQRNYGVNPVVDRAIAPSQFVDGMAQYRPDSSEIAFLSNRSGTQQLWLKTDSGLKQLTRTEAGVDSYIWLANGTELVYISDEKLWRLRVVQSESQLLAQELAFAGVPLQLYQGLNDSIVLSTVIEQQPELIELNINELSVEVLYQGKTDWAQRVSNNTVLLNSSGQLEKWQQGQRVAINALPELTLQWRYLWRDNAVYLQDKQHNLWRYEPISEVAEVIGKYDENSLFMTDYQADKQLMLSDNFAEQASELVILY